MKYGVDLSSHNPDDLGFMTNLRNAGAEYAIVKLTESTNYINPKAANQINNADKLMMATAGYHFARFGGDTNQALVEAQFLVNTAVSYLRKGSILVLDYEADASGDVNANTNAVVAFMTEVKNAGYIPWYYSYKPFTQQNIDQPKVNSHFPNSTWIAGYPGPVDEPVFDYFPSMDGVVMWQFTDNWHNLGVDGNVLLLDWPEGKGDEIVSNWNGEHVYSKDGTWYLLDDKGNKTNTVADGIIGHMGAYWVFSKGLIVHSTFIEAWSNLYWVGAEGKVMQGKKMGPYKGFTFDAGDDNTFYIRSLNVADAKQAAELLNK